MKKIIAILCALFIISGCSEKESEQTLFVEKHNQYALCDMEGDLKTKFIYDDYEAVGTSGYVVREKKKYSYISKEGKTIIKSKKDVQLSVLENMILARDKDKKYTIYNEEGKKLYQTSKKEKIIISGLPIIQQDKKYLVLDSNGEVLVESKDRITCASIYDSSYVSVSYKKKTVLYDLSAGDDGEIESKLAGDYAIVLHDYSHGYILYDEENEKIARVNTKGKVVFEQETHADKIQLKSDSLIVENDDNTYVLSLDGKVFEKVDSYYRDAKNYLVKNESFIYGPHQFIHNGKTKEVEGIQLNPQITYTSQDIFPVYVKDKGYQYYDFTGKKVIKTTYQSAGDFDRNHLAVVSKDDEDVYLIDKNGKKISHKYVDIQLIGKQYYAAYTTPSKYEVIDKNGEKVINDYFMGKNDIIVYNNETLGVFNKSGTTYVYNMEDYEVIFSLEGEYTFHEDGYFVKSSGFAYYDMEGNLIYKR